MVLLTNIPLRKKTPLPCVIPLRLVDSISRLGTLSQTRVGETVYRQNDPADYWYCIVSGAARECTVMADGRRQIVDFLLPGDLFGFCIRADRHMFSVETIARTTTLVRFSRRSVEALAASDSDVGRTLREMTLESIVRLQERTVLLGRSTAVERVGAFLLEMLDRSTNHGGDELILPMSRYDIADYLGIAVETLSRAFTALRQNGAIALQGSRDVHILNRDMLENEGTTEQQRCCGGAMMRQRRPLVSSET